jgi:hypothetical protein
MPKKIIKDVVTAVDKATAIPSAVTKVARTTSNSVVDAGQDLIEAKRNFWTTIHQVPRWQLIAGIVVLVTGGYIF